MFILSAHGSVVLSFPCYSVLLLQAGLMVQPRLCEGADSVLVLWTRSPCSVDDWQDVCACAPDKAWLFNCKRIKVLFIHWPHGSDGYQHAVCTRQTDRDGEHGFDLLQLCEVCEAKVLWYIEEIIISYIFACFLSV